jgi:malonate transporter
MSTILVEALVPMFFVLLLGYTAGRLRIINNAHVIELNTVVMTYAVPAAVFVATASSAREGLLRQWPMLVVQGSVMLLLFAAWYLLQRDFVRRSASESALQALTVALPNYAAAGLPVAMALFGPAQTVPVAVAIAAGAVLPSPVALDVLELSTAKSTGSGTSSATRFMRAMRHALLKPIVLVPLLGALWAICGWRLPTTAVASFSLLGDAAGGMALFVTGLVLSAQRFRLTWNTALATAAANILRPLMALAVCLALGVGVDDSKRAVLMAALPSGFFGIFFGAAYGVPSQESGSIVIASTVFSVLTLGFTISWLYG